MKIWHHVWNIWRTENSRFLPATVPVADKCSYPNLICLVYGEPENVSDLSTLLALLSEETYSQQAGKNLNSCCETLAEHEPAAVIKPSLMGMSCLTAANCTGQEPQHTTPTKLLCTLLTLQHSNLCKTKFKSETKGRFLIYWANYTQYWQVPFSANYQNMHLLSTRQIPFVLPYCCCSSNVEHLLGSWPRKDLELNQWFWKLHSVSHKPGLGSAL